MAGSAFSRTTRPPRLGAALGASDISTERTTAWSPPTRVAPWEREEGEAAHAAPGCAMGRTGGLRAVFLLALRATSRVYKGWTGRRCVDRGWTRKRWTETGDACLLPDHGTLWEDVGYDISCPAMQGTPTCRPCQVRRRNFPPTRLRESLGGG